MATQQDQPNQFVLKGRNTEITYSTSSFGGRPQLSYQDTQRQATFSGADIRVVEHAEFGKLVSVTLEQIPDLHTLTLTLLIPAINLGGQEQRFKTVAILTTQRTSIGGPGLVQGALQTYRTVALNGAARNVEFIA